MSAPAPSPQAISPHDSLKLANEANVITMLKKQGQNFPDTEVVIYSNLVVKINKKGREQTRVFLVTNKAVYNLLPKKFTCKRRIKIDDIASVTLSSKSEEFALHIPTEYDYRFKSKEKKTIGKVLKQAFEAIQKANNSESLLPVNSVDKETLWGQTVTKEQAKILTRAERYRRLKELREQGMPMEKGELEAEVKEAGDATHYADAKTEKVAPDDFDFLKVIGRGAFGKVMQVRHKTTKQIYAMKILRKKQIVKRNQVEHTKSERKILQALKHPFLMTLRYAMQTDSKLYFVLDYYKGGELFFHLKKRRKFTEAEALIFVAEVALALGHLHSLDIIYRDLKPENILLHESGHICLTDFGLSKDLDPMMPEATTFCGTPEYLAPEIVSHQGHGKAVDWWSLGILCYELCIGIPPFYHQNLNSMYSKINTEKPKFPASVSQNVQDLITKLLVKKPENRLGSNKDIDDIKKHKWFKTAWKDGLDWDKLYKKEIDPPYKPKVKSDTDTSNFSTEFTKETAADTYAPPANLGGEEFSGFSFKPDSDPLNAAKKA